MTPVRVVVTGAVGKLGLAVVTDLVAAGYDVVGFDQLPARDRAVPGAAYRIGEVTDVGQVAGALAGASALIHLAAIPAPGEHADEAVFHTNVMGTFAALQAAALAGVRTVALASSGSAYGTAWSPEPTTVDYVPVDEAHPLRNADPYGLSKEINEATAAMFVRRHAMRIAALRFHWIATRDEQLRRLGSPEPPEAELRNLWGYVDISDAARACRLAIEAAADPAFGFVAMNIVARDVLSRESVTDLLRRHAPQVEVRSALSPDAGAYDISVAARAIGWVPEHSWRNPV